MFQNLILSIRSETPQTIARLLQSGNSSILEEISALQKKVLTPVTFIVFCIQLHITNLSTKQ